MIKLKKSVKVFIVIFIFIALILMCTNVLATGMFMPSKINGNESVLPINKMKKVGNAVLQILRYLSIAASVIVLIIIGIKYMLGSTEEKAEYKKTLIPYIIGALLVFAASAFVGVMYDWFTKL